MEDKKLREYARKRVQFKKQCTLFVIINTFLWGVWLVESLLHGFDFPWPVYPTAGWGLALVVQYFGKFSQVSQEELIEKEYQKLKRQQRR